MPTIYYIRHGKTEWNTLGRFQGLQDIPLNDLGRVEATKAGDILRELLAREGRDPFELGFVTSPLVRARQTAELLTPLLRRERRLQIVDALSPSGDHNGLFSQLADAEIEGGLALVGHEPDMGEIGSRLLFGEPRDVMTFKKGGVACIEVEADDEGPFGMLRWMLTPKQMRAMTSSSKVG